MEPPTPEFPPKCSDGDRLEAGAAAASSFKNCSSYKNENRSPSYSPPLLGSAASSGSPVGSRGHGTASEKNRKDRERIKMIRERQEQDHERRIAELRAAQEREEKIRHLKEVEREKRIRELRDRDAMRRHAVEERRKLLENQDNEKRQQIMAKYKEYEEKLAKENRSRRPVYAFGSSTPRTLAYLGQLDNSLKVYNARLSSAGTPGDGGGGGGVVKESTPVSKRAVSAISLNRRPLSSKRPGSVMTMSMHVPNPSVGHHHNHLPHNAHNDLASPNDSTLAAATSMTASFAAGDTPTKSTLRNVRLRATPPPSSRSQSTPRVRPSTATSSTSASSSAAASTTAAQRKIQVPPKKTLSHVQQTEEEAKSALADRRRIVREQNEREKERETERQKEEEKKKEEEERLRREEEELAAKAAMAERRRLAREEMEKEKELERQREEQMKLEEEERLRREEEEFRRQEEEELRALEEARRAEEERLRLAMEEQRLKREEEERKAEEEKRRQAEAEAKAREQAERAEKERREAEEKMKKEEEERLERKKKLDAIRQRTGLSNAAATNSTNKTPSTQNLSASVSVAHNQMQNAAGNGDVNGLSHSFNFGSSEELNKSISSGTLSASSSILQRLATNKTSEVRSSVENIMSRVRSTPNAQQLTTTAMTKSMMVTSNSDGKMSNGNNNVDDSRMTSSMYDVPSDSTSTEKTQYGVDAALKSPTASVSRFAEIANNDSTSASTNFDVAADVNANNLNGTISSGDDDYLNNRHHTTTNHQRTS